ncbi:unnamed protein product [Urochloa humidicola]
MAEIASSAVKPLLSLISNEAQLQRGISGDLQFIKDEVEMMAGFLQNLARSTAGAGGDHQLRTLMEQVMDLAYDSKICITGYERSGHAPGYHRSSLVGLLLRVVWLPRQLLVRRRVATQILRLKIRLRDIGERQQRYHISLPSGTFGAPEAQRQREEEWLQSTHPARDSPRWSILDGPDILTQAKVEVLQWVVAISEQNHPRLWLMTNVLGVVTLEGVHGASLADQVYHHFRGSSGLAPLNFDCTVYVKVQRVPQLVVTLLDMLRQICSEEFFRSRTSTVETWDADRVTRELRECLRGKRLLLLLSDMDYPKLWHFIRKRLESLQCSSRSVVVFCTNDTEVMGKCYPSEAKIYSLVDFYTKKAAALVPIKFDLEELGRFHFLIKQILGRCSPDVYSMNLFLHALLSNPNRTEKELESLYWSLDQVRDANSIERQSLMLTFCYHGLHKDYQNCLWYSIAFTRGMFKVRRASLLRRWAAEGFLKRGYQASVMTEAERCFDALFTQKLLLPREVCGTGKIKSCGPNALLCPKIRDATTDEVLLDANQPPADLQLDVSICKGIQLRRMESGSSAVDRVMAFLMSLPTPSSFQALRVLELEGYKGFTKRHLKNICKIHELKYLSLRNTDVEQLPKKINKLLNLETLDIRGTRVKELNAVLPMLKHFLAGRISFTGQEDTVKPKESFSTVCLPHGATRMTNLEVLSHVKVSNNAKELQGAASKLPMLRKLGVVLSGKRHDLKNIFDEIRQFNRCFTSFSIRVEQQENQSTAPAAVLTLPSCLQSLRICGIVGWLPGSIRDLHQLTKITLRETVLSEGVLPILGALEGLVCLRLLYHSIMAVAPVFEAGQFRSLKDLVIEDDMIQSISFAPGTSPMLDKIVWSFHHMNSLSGVQNLPSLRYLQLNRGTYESDDGLRNLQRDIPNHVHFILH